MCREKSQRFPEDLILNWFLQIVFALKHIHTHKILHRDLKTSNLFLCSNGVVKIGDFGISRILHGTLESAETIVGTPYYMSPEVCQNKPYSYKSDIWSLGCILYELCTLEHAFKANNLLGLVYKIIQEKQDPIPGCYSPDLHRLLNSLLLKNSAVRPSLDKLLISPFMQKVLCKFLPPESISELNVELKSSYLQEEKETHGLFEEDMCLTPQQKIKRNKEEAARRREEELRQALDSQMTKSGAQHSKVMKMEQMRSVFDKEKSYVYSDKTVVSQVLDNSSIKSSTGGIQNKSHSLSQSQNKKMETSYKDYPTETIKSIEMSGNYEHQFKYTGEGGLGQLTMNNDYVTYNFSNKSLYNQTLRDIQLQGKTRDRDLETADSKLGNLHIKTAKDFSKKPSEEKDEFASDFEELEEYISEGEIDDEVGDFNNTLQSRTARHPNLSKFKDKLSTKIGPKLFGEIYEFINKHRNLNTSDTVIMKQAMAKFGKGNAAHCFEVDQLIFRERNKLN